MLCRQGFSSTDCQPVVRGDLNIFKKSTSSAGKNGQAGWFERVYQESHYFLNTRESYSPTFAKLSNLLYIAELCKEIKRK